MSQPCAAVHLARCGSNEASQVKAGGWGGGGLRRPKPEKIAVKLRKIAVNCGKLR